MRRMLLAGLIFSLVACGSDGVVDPSVSVAGSYALERVDGTALPYPVVDISTYHIQLVSGSLALNANNTYVWNLGLRVDDSGRIRADSTSDAGTWAIVNNALSLTSTQGNLPKTATVSRNVMTMQSSAIVFELRKQ